VAANCAPGRSLLSTTALVQVVCRCYFRFQKLANVFMNQFPDLKIDIDAELAYYKVSACMSLSLFVYFTVDKLVRCTAAAHQAINRLTLQRFGQGVALTGRNTTGPPCSVTDDDRRRQTPESKTILAPYTICRRASNKPQRNIQTEIHSWRH